MMRTTIPVPVKAQPSMPRLVNVTTRAPATKSAIDKARLVRAFLVIIIIIIKSTLRSKWKQVEANNFTSWSHPTENTLVKGALEIRAISTVPLSVPLKGFLVRGGLDGEQVIDDRS